VLVVDDNTDSADSLVTLLELLGHTTVAAYDGLSALEVAEQFRPEVVLLDLGLPRLNGFEVCAMIRKQPWGKDTVLVAASGWGQEADRKKSADAGFDHHLVKPLDYGELRKLLA
jgi:CheY-like chemotaxis protein